MVECLEVVAKRKWCPMARIASAKSANRYDGYKKDSEALCIASACMMWVPGSPNTAEEFGHCGLTNQK